MIPKWNGIVVSEAYFYYLVREMLNEIEAELIYQATGNWRDST
jgi:hypothetical protein